MDITNIILLVGLALILLAVIYRILPYKSLSAQKPALVFFPKYVFQISDVESAEKTMEQLGFKAHKGSNIYIRGYILGDFSAKLSRLTVTLEGQTAYLGAPLLGLFFDTGDLWQIATDIQGEKPHRH
ncbi:MAG: hypothetical protein ABJN40_21510 [Sneathiella sp.]